MLKKKTKNEVSETDINRYKLVQLIIDAMKRTSTRDTIQSTFKYSGVCPWNVNMPLSNYRIRESEITYKEINLQKKTDRININASILTSETVISKIETYKEKQKEKKKIKTIKENKEKQKILKKAEKVKKILSNQSKIAKKSVNNKSIIPTSTVNT